VGGADSLDRGRHFIRRRVVQSRTVLNAYSSLFFIVFAKRITPRTRAKSSRRFHSPITRPLSTRREWDLLFLSHVVFKSHPSFDDLFSWILLNRFFLPPLFYSCRSSLRLRRDRRRSWQSPPTRRARCPARHRPRDSVPRLLPSHLEATAHHRHHRRLQRLVSPLACAYPTCRRCHLRRYFHQVRLPLPKESARLWRHRHR